MRLIFDRTVPSLYLNAERPRINTSGAKTHYGKNKRTTNVDGEGHEPGGDGDGRNDQIFLPDCHSVARKT